MDNRIKLQRFKDAVLSDSRERADALAAEAQKRADETLAGVQDREKARYIKESSRLDDSLILSAQRESARLELRARKNVLAYRKTLVDGIFDEVRERLVSFAKSDKYKAYLFRKLEEAEERFPEGGVCQLRAADMSYAKEIRSRFGFASEESGSIMIGGFYLMPIGSTVMLDQTLDSAFDEQREAFCDEHSELELKTN